MKEKKCPLCETTKDIIQFYRYFSKPRNKYRYSNYCIPCARENSKVRSKQYFKDNREDRLSYAKNYRLNNQDKIKISSAKFSKKYREELKECYVAEFAAKSLKCSTKEIHDNPELLTAYRNNMQLKRLIKNYAKK